MNTITFREQIYKREEQLSPFACRSNCSRGRIFPVPESPTRTEFMRDRDRIIHSRAFRRLSDKTQVFLLVAGSHFRTRLTHTLEVCALARTISKALRLNEDLTEAIALGHDLGHAPFGHMGERALQKLVHFEHNEQSLRVVEFLEGGSGLNLTFEVRDGILNHKKGLTAATLEGNIVNICDRIAYLNHDIDDAVRAGLLTEIPKNFRDFLGERHSERINTMVEDVITESYDSPVIKMSARIEQVTDELREFMFKNVYEDSRAAEQEHRVDLIISKLFEFYCACPELTGSNRIEEDGPARCAADYIAGMTDNFAVSTFTSLYLPEGL